MKILYTLIILSLLTACEKKEIAVKKYNRGELNTASIEMGADYRHQVWFSLADNRVVRTNLKTEWDLCFESNETGEHVYLNGSKAMKVFKTTATQLTQVNDTTGIGAGGKADMPSGCRDSTGVGDWPNDSRVYVVNTGYDEKGRHTGYIKLKPKTVTPFGYTFEYADISGTSSREGTVTKDARYNAVYYSFAKHAQVSIEPPKIAYDLCFTQYTHLFHEPLQYYQVTGVLNNTYKCRIACIADKAFGAVNIGDTIGLAFRTTRNVIGYDWKTFDLGNNQYTVNPNLCYLIQDNKGFYYKLHFVDFYNAIGEKGHPKFEYKKL